MGVILVKIGLNFAVDETDGRLGPRGTLGETDRGRETRGETDRWRDAGRHEQTERVTEGDGQRQEETWDETETRGDKETRGETDRDAVMRRIETQRNAGRARQT